ncbi:MAG TPA: bifunctional oligoribonuclease/PAP phosphatase NrnA, partial [Candidatus Deferrimicrobium sp.]|nr:bifunctional oligoribonuclease/PAP phosphatase NrnA [Candidatus Deferrimicrobium sp.]
GKEVCLVREAEVPARYQFLPGAGAIRHVDSCGDELPADTALILECPNIGRIGQAQRLLGAEVCIVNIDHHQDNELFGDVNWVDAKISSAGEMAYRYFLQVGYAITADVAVQLYTAILTDTGRFRYSSTSSRTMEVAGLLIEAGADPQRICDQVYFNLRPSTMKLIGKVLNSVEFYGDGQICVITLTREMLEQTGALPSEAEGLVDYTLFTEGVLAGAMLKEGNANGTKVSMRSRDGINVARLAARFGGGGHPNASGCTLPVPLATAKGEIIGLLEEARRDQSR